MVRHVELVLTSLLMEASLRDSGRGVAELFPGMNE